MYVDFLQISIFLFFFFFFLSQFIRKIRSLLEVCFTTIQMNYTYSSYIWILHFIFPFLHLNSYIHILHLHLLHLSYLLDFLHIRLRLIRNGINILIFTVFYRNQIKQMEQNRRREVQAAMAVVWHSIRIRPISCMWSEFPSNSS